MIISKSNMEIIPCKFSLGEGLNTSDNRSCWVDINDKKLAIYEDEKLTLIKLEFIPSLVIKQHKNEITLCADSGIYKYKLKENLFCNTISIVPWNISQFRTNDGGFCRNYFIFGTMHRINPKKNKGSIYYLKDNNFHYLDINLHIPNTFIELDPGKILISDSLKGEIWQYSFDSEMKLTEKKLWYQLQAGYAPDGGCVIGDKIYIAIWDASKVMVFSTKGKIIEEILLPVKRPTNCKYNKKFNKLWITSAREGMTEFELKKYPHSGDTFIYHLGDHE